MNRQDSDFGTWSYDQVDRNGNVTYEFKKCPYMNVVNLGTIMEILDIFLRLESGA